MKTAFVTCLILAALTAAPVHAAGLIQSLPPDGSWVKYDVTGESVDASGKTQVAMTGTLTLRSVGREMIDGEVCRWIEIEMVVMPKRGDGAVTTVTELTKLLIPEKFLEAAENPRAHVLKAMKGGDDGKGHELDLQGRDARQIESLDELFHSLLPSAGDPEKAEIKVPAGTFAGMLYRAKEKSPDREMGTESWRAGKVPFGLAAYRCTKLRLRDEKPVGGRVLDLRAAKFGADAKSKIVK